MKLVRIPEIGHNISLLSQLRLLLLKHSRIFIARYFASDEGASERFNKLLHELAITMESLRLEFEYRKMTG